LSQARPDARRRLHQAGSGDDLVLLSAVRALERDEAAGVWQTGATQPQIANDQVDDGACRVRSFHPVYLASDLMVAGEKESGRRRYGQRRQQRSNQELGGREAPVVSV
jgi:hypothetical protein